MSKPRFGVLVEFRDFLMRGNLVDLAVAFVAGVAFTGLVKSLVDNIVSPVVAIIGGQPNFRSSLILEVNGAEILFGSFLTDVITFLITMVAVFFLIVKPINALRKKLIAKPKEEPTPEHDLVAALKSVRVVTDGDGYTFESKS